MILRLAVQRNVQTMMEIIGINSKMQNERSRCEIRLAQDNNLFSIGTPAGLSQMLMIFISSSLRHTLLSYYRQAFSEYSRYSV